MNNLPTDCLTGRSSDPAINSATGRLPDSPADR